MIILHYLSLIAENSRAPPNSWEGKSLPPHNGGVKGGQGAYFQGGDYTSSTLYLSSFFLYSRAPLEQVHHWVEQLPPGYNWRVKQTLPGSNRRVKQALPGSNRRVKQALPGYNWRVKQALPGYNWRVKWAASLNQPRRTRLPEQWLRKEG